MIMLHSKMGSSWLEENWQKKTGSMIGECCIVSIQLLLDSLPLLFLDNLLVWRFVANKLTHDRKVIT